MSEGCDRPECVEAHRIMAAVVEEQRAARETYEAVGMRVGEAHDRWHAAWRARVGLVNTWMRKAGVR